WTRDQLTQWGLTNAHLEAWGPFGRGWVLKRFSAQIIEPQTIPLIACPKSWSPGFDQPVTAEGVHLAANSQPDLHKCKGKLKGSTVLTSPARPVKARFEPLASRMEETNLLRLANASASDSRRFPRRSGGDETGRPRFGANNERGGDSDASAPDDPPRSGDARRSALEGSRRGGSTNLAPGRILSFLAKEQVALVVSPSSQGDGGTLFVSSASVPGAEGRGANARSNAPRVWSTNAPVIPAQITLAIEDYNRLVRMLQQGEKLKMAVDLQVEFPDDDLMAY